METAFVIARRHPAQDSAALALAAQACPDAERAAYEEAVRKQLESGQEHGVVLLAARDADRLVAAQLAQVLPGNVALIWRPCLAASALADTTELLTNFCARMSSELAASGAHLGQALTGPDDVESSRLFASSGFLRAAELLYMAALPEEQVLEAPLPFELTPLKTDEEARLAALIERTYAGTLDCPGLDGLRETADVIAGYRSVGDYRPELWLLAQHAGRDVGCLLMNLHADVQHLEIVYLGFAPEVRGRGWGLRLARFARGVAHQRGAEQVVLAVDATNRPAIRLYENAGYFVFDRRTVWIMAFGKDTQPIHTK